MKKIKRIVYDSVPVGMYLVLFNTYQDAPCNPGEHEDCFIHGCVDNEPSLISEIDFEIIKVTENNYLNLQVEVVNKNDTWNEDLLSSDTHDLRPRLFKTLKQAKIHAKFTEERFANPQPWESFIKTE